MNGYKQNDRGESSGEMCCLLEEGVRCTRSASCATYNKRIQNKVTTHRLNLLLDSSVRHIYICPYHKLFIQNGGAGMSKRNRLVSEAEEDAGKFATQNGASVSGSSSRKRRSSEMDPESGENDGSEGIPEPDFSSLNINVLRRFKKMYKVNTKPGLTKAQLADVVAANFRLIKVSEREILTQFISHVKNGRGRPDRGENI